MELSGRVAIVTGGCSGIGAAAADALESQGVHVARWDISPAAPFVCNVADESSVEAALAHTVERLGEPTLLVAAAGVMHGSPIVSTTRQDWQRVIDVNLTGVFLTIKAVARRMRAGRRDGSFVTVSSVNGVISDPVLSAYSASKAAVIQLTKVAALELAEVGIRVNAVLPGPTETAMFAPFLDDDYRNAIAEATPLGRVGTPRDIAEATINLMRSGWVTGVAVPVDGGASLVTARGNSEHRKKNLQLG